MHSIDYVFKKSDDLLQINAFLDGIKERANPHPLQPIPFFNVRVAQLEDMRSTRLKYGTYYLSTLQEDGKSAALYLERESKTVRVVGDDYPFLENVKKLMGVALKKSSIDERLVRECDIELGKKEEEEDL
jgi:hypothetical protein